MKKAFETKIRELMQDKESRSVLMDENHYNELVAETKEAKKRKSFGLSLSTKHYRRLKRFDLLGDKLIQKQSSNKPDIIYFCTSTEMFDVLHFTHLSIGHKKEKKMELMLKGKYCNITRQAIRTYLDLCEFCTSKKLARSVGVAVKRELLDESQDPNNSRERVEFIGVDDSAQIDEFAQENSSSPHSTKRNFEITPINLAAASRPLQKIKKLKTMLPSEMQNNSFGAEMSSSVPISISTSTSTPITSINREIDDVFDQFGKYIACELKSLPPREAILVKQEIQNTITKVHLSLFQPQLTNNFDYNHQPMPIDYVSPTYSHSSDSDSVDP